MVVCISRLGSMLNRILVCINRLILLVWSSKFLFTCLPLKSLYQVQVFGSTEVLALGCPALHTSMSPHLVMHFLVIAPPGNDQLTSIIDQSI